MDFWVILFYMRFDNFNLALNYPKMMNVVVSENKKAHMFGNHSTIDFEVKINYVVEKLLQVTSKF